MSILSKSITKTTVYDFLIGLEESKRLGLLTCIHEFHDKLW